MKNIKKSLLLLLAMMLILTVACNSTQNDVTDDMQNGGDITSPDDKNPDLPDEPTTPNEPEKPSEPTDPSKPDTPVTPDDPNQPTTPDEPIVQTWKDKVTDSGYKGAKVILKEGDKTAQQTVDKTFADQIYYISTLKDPKQSNGPSSYSDYTSFSVAFDDPSGNNYGIDFVYVKKNGTNYLAVKEDKENIRWLTADAVTYFDEIVKENNIKLG